MTYLHRLDEGRRGLDLVAARDWTGPLRVPDTQWRGQRGQKK